MVTQSQQQMTSAEFFALPPQTQPTELIYGELVVSPTPAPKHQNVVLNTYTVIRRISKTVSGKVFAVGNKEALPFVSVIIKGTTIGAQTDFDGSYSIKAKSGDVLERCHVGHRSEIRK